MHSQGFSQTGSVRTDPAAAYSPDPRHLPGSGVSAGIVVGKALLVGRCLPPVVEVELDPSQVDAEIARFKQALSTSAEQLEELRQRVAVAIGDDDAAIFDAHLMLVADQLAPHVDFFSLGTNDLIQYLLAVDRANPDIAHLYQPAHPSVIRLIREVARAAHSNGKWIGICGEMAADPLFVPLVLGLGIHELSLAPVAIGLVKSLVRRIRMHEAEALVNQAVGCGTAAEVLSLCDEFVRRLAPDLVRQ